MNGGRTGQRTSATSGKAPGHVDRIGILGQSAHHLLAVGEVGISALYNGAIEETETIDDFGRSVMYKDKHHAISAMIANAVVFYMVFIVAMFFSNQLGEDLAYISLPQDPNGSFSYNGKKYAMPHEYTGDRSGVRAYWMIIYFSPGLVAFFLLCGAYTITAINRIKLLWRALADNSAGRTAKLHLALPPAALTVCTLLILTTLTWAIYIRDFDFFYTDWYNVFIPMLVALGLSLLYSMYYAWKKFTNANFLYSMVQNSSRLFKDGKVVA